MAKPIVHARNSVRRWGGSVDDYLPTHEFLDSSKAHVADVRHRAVLHSSFGIFLAEKVLGRTLTNSDGREVHVRDVAEAHIIEDLGRIPSLHEWLAGMPVEPWMAGARPKPPAPDRAAADRPEPDTSPKDETL